MIRKLLCRKCGDKFKMHPEDIRDGWLHRLVYVAAVVPEGHGMTFITEGQAPQFTPLTDLLCDYCSEPITGENVAALTMWQTSREGEPGPWEREYGTVLTPEVLDMADKLKGKK
jgi:hypothetical protein